MKRVAVISAILEEPDICQQQFNEIISKYKNIIRGRMGIPCEVENISVISIVVAILILIFTEPIVKIFAIGFKGEALSITVKFTKIMLFGIILHKK